MERDGEEMGSNGGGGKGGIGGEGGEGQDKVKIIFLKVFN